MTDPEMRPLAPRLLYEDDGVRVWDMTLEPGESWGPHEHAHDYVVVLVEGDRVALQEHRTSSGLPPEYREAEVTAGFSLFVPAGGAETAINVGNQRYRDIEIELKRTGPASA